MKSIWLTRSFAQNLQLKEQLKAHSFMFINYPLITYTDDNEIFNSNILSKYTNIVVTSKYAAARIAVNHSAFNNSKCICAWVVGYNSAEILRNVGFQIGFVALNVKHLLANLPELLYSDTVYLSGSIITQSLPMKIERLIIYNVEYNSKLDQCMINTLEQGVDYILLYSGNCAKALVKIMINYCLADQLKKSIIIALSLKIAEKVSPYFNTVLHCNEELRDTITELLITNEKYGK